MNYTAFYKYFRSKKWPVLVGLILAVIGALVAFIFMRQRHGMAFSTVGIVLAIVGIGFILAGLGGKANPSDFSHEIDISLRDYKEKALKAFKLEEKHIRTIPLYEPYQIGEFDFTGEEPLLVKKGNDGKVRSNFYVNTLIMFAAQKLCVYSTRFSFTEDNEKVSSNQIPYTEIDSIYVTEDSYTDEYQGVKTVAKYAMLNVKARNGEVISFPAHNDADVDNFIASTMKLVDKMKAAAGQQ